jgi:hypothetical protein
MPGSDPKSSSWGTGNQGITWCHRSAPSLLCLSNTALSGEGRGSLAGADFVHSNATLGRSPQANFTG